MVRYAIGQNHEKWNNSSCRRVCMQQADGCHGAGKADDTIAKIMLQMDTGHKMNCPTAALLIVDQVYCELVGKNRQERLSRLLTKQQIRFMKSMKTFPSVLRTEYTYALLKENDNKKASKLKMNLRKWAHTILIRRKLKVNGN